MKMTVVALSCLAGAAVAFAAGVAGGGKTGTAIPGAQIGVVGMVEILQALSNERGHVDEIVADHKKARVELDALAKQIENEEAELTTLKPSSEDYLKQAEAVAEKKAHYSAHRDYLDRQGLLKQQQWTQKSYGEIARAIREVAAEKGLSLVLVKDDPNMATPALIATQKVPYWGSCPDITQEVQAKLIAGKP